MELLPRTKSLRSIALPGKGRCGRQFVSAMSKLASEPTTHSQPSDSSYSRAASMTSRQYERPEAQSHRQSFSHNVKTLPSHLVPRPRSTTAPPSSSYQLAWRRARPRLLAWHSPSCTDAAQQLITDSCSPQSTLHHPVLETNDNGEGARGRGRGSRREG